MSLTHAPGDPKGTQDRPALRILEDDLTGALDTAARFVGLLGPIPVMPDDSDLPAGSAALNTGTRDGSEDHAVATTERFSPWLADARIAFKKVDSLLRGHVAAELRACLPSFDHTILAPAFPAQGRITREGQKRRRDGAVWVNVGCDPATLPATMRDAETDADLTRIVAEGQRLLGRTLWCGTAGLAGALAGHRPVPCPVLSGLVVAMIGSHHPLTRRQIETARSHPGLILHEPRIPPGTAPPVATRMIEERFATILRSQRRPGVLFVSGGETLAGVCRSLRVHHLDVDGEFEPGVPCSVLRGGAWDGQRVVSKSGAFGDDAFLLRLLMHTGAPSDPERR